MWWVKEGPSPARFMAAAMTWGSESATLAVKIVTPTQANSSCSRIDIARLHVRHGWRLLD
jgi:hypothetical protein